MVPPPVPARSQELRPQARSGADSRRFVVAAGVGWPDLFAMDLRYRVAPQVGFGVSLGLASSPTGALAPFSSYQALPTANLRYYTSRHPSSAFLQLGVGSQVAGIFGGTGLVALPLLMVSYGYEWRLAGGLTASVDGGAAFNFSQNGGSTSPALRIALRFGYAAP